MERKHKWEMTDKHKKIVSIIGIIIFVLLFVIVGWFIGKPMVEHIEEPEKFKQWVSGYGMWSWLVCIGIMVLQIIVAIIPGGFVEIGAGYAFGTVIGSALCLIGSMIGCVIVFQFVRLFGVKIIEAFFSLDKIRSLRFLQEERKRNVLAFIIFLIPGMPKDLISYFMGLTEMKLGTWIIISTIARAPAIIVSCMSGSALGEQDYITSAIVFVALVLLTALGAFMYKKLCARYAKRKNRKQIDKSSIDGSR